MRIPSLSIKMSVLHTGIWLFVIGHISVTHATESMRLYQKQRHFLINLDCSSQKSKIMNVQSALIERGYDAGSIDGVMGKQTRAALKVFQYENGDYPDGIIQKSVMKKLDLNC